MIIKYREHNEVVELHSDDHGVCTHQDELDPGWECTCTDCKCESVVRIQARYSYNSHDSHEVIVEFNPGQYHGGGSVALPPNVARALASALCFAANDADTLNKDFA